MKEQLEKAWELFDSGAVADSESLYLGCLSHVSESEHDDYRAVLMGLVYTECFLEKYEPARMYAGRLLQCAQNDEEKHVAVHQAGMVERMAGSYAEAMRLFQQEEEIISASFPGYSMRISVNLYEQGYVYLRMGSLRAAEEKMALSLEHAQKCGDAMCIGCAYRGLGEIMNECGRREKGRICFEQALAYFELAGDKTAVDELNSMM